MDTAIKSPLRNYRMRFDPPKTKAALARDLGVDRATVTRWERGKRMPQPSDWPKIEEVTGVTAAELAAFRAVVRPQHEAA